MLEKVIDIFSEVLDIDKTNISQNTDIADELSADSIDIVEIMLEIENEVGIFIPDEAIPEFRFVGDIVKYIENHKNQTPERNI